jgi:hypothetical protein
VGQGGSARQRQPGYIVDGLASLAASFLYFALMCKKASFAA